MVYVYIKKMKNTEINAVVPMSERNHVKIEYVSEKMIFQVVFHFPLVETQVQYN